MDPQKSRSLISSGYIVATLWAIFSLIDLVVRLYPVRFSATTWRVGAVGLGSLSLATLLLALFILCVTASLLQHRRVLRTLSVLSVVAGVALASLLPLFLLDVIELRRLVPPEARLPFDWGMGRAAVMLLLSSGAFLWIGRSGWKATVVGRKSAAKDSTLLPGTSALARH